MRKGRLFVAGLAAIASLGACDGPTVLRLRIRTDYLVPEELQAVRVIVHPEGAFAPDPTVDPPFTLDQTFTLERVDEEGVLLDVVPFAPLGDPDGRRVRIDVTPMFAPGAGCPAGVGYQAASIVAAFVPGQLDEVPIPIVRSCCRDACPPLTYCLRGTCAPEDGRCDERFAGVTYACGVGVCEETVDLCVQGEVNEDCVERPQQLDRCPVAEASRDGDCDGTMDTMAVAATYRDRDGDTYGDANDITEACNPRPGYASRAGDCDETRASVHTDAVETCNALDDDCDERVDEGVTRSCNLGCEDGREYCTAGAFGGCDAREPTVEICNGIDDDCNGRTDEDRTLAIGCDAVCTPLCVGSSTNEFACTFLGCGTFSCDPETQVRPCCRPNGTRGSFPPCPSPLVVQTFRTDRLSPGDPVWCCYP